MPNLTTTIGVIKTYDPCESGLKLSTDSIKNYDDSTRITLSHVLENNGVKDAVWFLRCFKISEYYLFCSDMARSVLHLFEGGYPKDKILMEDQEVIRIHLHSLSTHQYETPSAFNTAVIVINTATSAVVGSCDSDNNIAAQKARLEKWAEIESLLIKHINR